MCRCESIRRPRDARNAFWPRLSPDGSQLVYVSFDPNSNVNDLYVANSDGTHARLVLPSGTFQAVDAPLFSPDGSMIMFSAVARGPTPALSWLDQLLGVQIASAHNIPSDWWRVPVSGGKPEQLTHILDTGMYASFAPDAQHVAFVSASGLYVMEPDGKGLVQLLGFGPIGTVDWLP